MSFSKFISIVLGILGSYYFIIILFDILKSGTQTVQANNHIIRFENKETPIIVAEDPKRSESFLSSGESSESNKYSKTEDREFKIDPVMKSPEINLGLETLSGDAYTVNAENLSKFMMS